MTKQKTRVISQRRRDGKGIDVYLGEDGLSDVDFDAEDSITPRRRVPVPEIRDVTAVEERKSKKKKKKRRKKGRKKQAATGAFALRIPEGAENDIDYDFDEFDQVESRPKKSKRNRKRNSKRVIAILFAIAAVAALGLVSVNSDDKADADPEELLDEYFPQKWEEPNLDPYPPEETSIDLLRCIQCCLELNERFDGGAIRNLTQGVKPPSYDLLHYRVCQSYGCAGYQYDCEEIDRDVFNENDGSAHPRDNPRRSCIIGQSFREEGYACFSAPEELEDVPEELQPIIDEFHLRSINFTCSADGLKVHLNDCNGSALTPRPTAPTTSEPTRSPTTGPPTESSSPTKSPTKSPISQVNFPTTPPPTAINSPVPTASPVVLNEITAVPTMSPTLLEPGSDNQTNTSDSSMVMIGAISGFSGASAVASVMNFRIIP
mmetsp:Transcript_4623/g.5718  ORF Transcript_4623/g.5718 Transcript_4623/m.5718 type:complete len:432 (+) Transcript_4623:156-1451(+)